MMELRRSDRAWARALGWSLMQCRAASRGVVESTIAESAGSATAKLAQAAMPRRARKGNWRIALAEAVCSIAWDEPRVMGMEWTHDIFCS